VLAVSAVAVHGGCLLLVERGGDRPDAGLWAVPGGRVEPGEPVRDAVVRELAEETGLRARCGDLVGWAERISPLHHFVILDFRVDLLDPDPRRAAVAGDDAAALAWVPLGDVAAHSLVPGLAQFLADHGVIPPAPAAAGGGPGAVSASDA
jgi:ADP-ribose pyrophosphatase YjhB (NUDIX family)